MKRWKTIGRAGLAALGLLVSIVVIKSMTLRSKQPAASPLSDAPVDNMAVAARLAETLTTRTISESRATPAPAAELDALRAQLERFYPRVHSSLAREIVGGHSLLYTWKGSGSRPPIILCAHQDVAPIEPGTEATWEAPPFGGKVERGFVFGRGALDDKGSLVAIMESVEALLAEGFAPTRTVYLAFGHDEEIYGYEGGAKIVELLKARNVHAEAVIDEGNVLVTGIVPGITEAVAAIGVGEKGHVTLTLSVDLAGGHSATSGADTALTVLTAAVTRLRHSPVPFRSDAPTFAFFDWLAPEMTFGQRLPLANLWLTRPLVAQLFSTIPALDASIRTTTAITTFHSGVKENVVPRAATAQADFHVLPGDTTDSVIAHVRAAIDDARVTITPHADTRFEPSRISSADAPVFRSIATVVREVFPRSVVTPSLFLGAATDGRKYEAVADDVYRFSPFHYAPEDLKRVHGNNERLSVAAVGDAVRFYRQVLRVTAGRQ